MRLATAVLVLSGVAFTHGESGRVVPPPTVGPQVLPVPGGTTTPTGSRGGPRSKTLPETSKTHRWTTWWAYNREHIFARRLRGTPVSGGSRLPINDRVTRKELREDVLFDLMVRALGDKSHHVRAAAAIALGKFGDPRANNRLARINSHPPEGWFDVRESAVYAMSILGLPDNRVEMKVIAGDKERAIKERGLSLLSFARDGTDQSLAILEWHLKYHRSSLRLRAHQEPTLPEEEKRRMAAHLFGFAKGDHDRLLSNVALGSRRWGPGVQGLAVTALGRRKARDYSSLLFRLMSNRQADDAVKQSVPLALGMMFNEKDKHLIDRLAQFVRDHRRDRIVQHFTIMALAGIGGDQVAGIFEKFLRDNVFADDEDRAFLFLGMGLVNKGKTTKLLMAEYERTRKPTKRAALAVALGLARYKPAVKQTIDYLERTTLAGGLEFLIYGTLALGLHGDERGLPTVRKMMKRYAVPEIRQRAAIALALLRRQQAVPELVEILEESGNVYTKAAVVTALGLIPEPTRRAVDALEEAYRRDSLPDSVRAMAIIALGALADPRVVPLSAELTRNYNYFIRCFALDEIASYL